MEAQFTVRDTLLNFAEWVNAYGLTHLRGFVKYGFDEALSGDTGWLMDTHAPNGFVRFRIQATNVERLEVKAETLDGSLAPSGDAELCAYFTEFVRAIRLKWTDEPGLNELERFYLNAVKGRPTERGKLEDYCNRLGVTDQTLRNWVKKFQGMGIDTK